jgi:cation diffusion facilitator family transporter
VRCLRVSTDAYDAPITAAPNLARLAWLAIAAAVATIALKTAAWALTGSVGFLSDAAESLVNLAAAVMALLILRWVARPPDAEHMYGHEKAEYFSAGVEGTLIIVAAAGIVWLAVERLVNPIVLSDVEVGIAVSIVASGINLAVARTLIRAGQAERSLTLEADGRHLMTDVWTSVGVVAGVAAVAVTGWERLDPLIALAVAANIVITGVQLMRRSAGGLMDRALEPDELAAVQVVLERHASPEVHFHALRTRRAGRRAFVTFHVLTPGTWTVQQGHDLSERVEADLRAALGNATVTTHLEPVEDPLSFVDVGLDRVSGRPSPRGPASRGEERT